MTVPQAFALALSHHQAGRLPDAERLYREILARQPDHAEALHALGIIAQQAGRHDVAEDLIRRAIGFAPGNPAAHLNLGAVLAARGRRDEAITEFRRALELQPDAADAHLNLGAALAEQGRGDEAITHYRRALQLQPDFATAHYNLGNALREGERFSEAAAAYRRALEIQPDFPEAHNNLGIVQARQGQIDEAMAAYRGALQLKEDYAEAHSNLGEALKNRGRLEEAVSAFRRSLQCKPDYADAHLNLALALLLRGCSEQGWREYEWRLRAPARAALARRFLVPQWDGRPVAGGVILAHAEQGFGDALLFARYLPLALARSEAARIIFECQPALAPLLAQLGGAGIDIVARGAANSAQPSFDFHVPLCSLPLALQCFAPVGPLVPRLQADGGLRAGWRRRLGSGRELRVGLVWAGNPRQNDDHYRSLAPEKLAPLLRVPGVRFVSLQVEPRGPLPPIFAEAGVLDFTAEISDFADSAALIAELDLIITVDTSTAHLAGTLGRPTWVLLTFVPYWPYGLDGEETPWYPTMRLFRQPATGDWESVIPRVAEELNRAVKEGLPGTEKRTFPRTVTVPQALALALSHHQAGRLPDAERLYREILARQPDHAEALHALGIIAQQAGRHDVAEDLIRRAIGFAPGNPAAHLNLGVVLAARGRRDEAITEFRRALELQPEAADAHLNLGAALAEQGQGDEAITHYHRALQLQPDFATAHYNLGNALREQERFSEAAASYRRALQTHPDFPEAHNNLGIALARQRRFDEAIIAYRRAIELHSDYAEAHNNLGEALKNRGHLEEAVSALRRSLQCKPEYADAHVNLGDALRLCGQQEEALAACRRALEINPDGVGAHLNLGIALAEYGCSDEAIAAYHRALELQPNYPEACNNLGYALKEQGRLEEAIAAFRRALELKPDFAMAHSNLVYTLQFQPGVEEAAMAGELRRWNERFARPRSAFVPPHTNDRDPARRLRIGYVTPEFRDHVTGRYLLPLFESHDRRSFELLCYSGTVRTDRMTEAFRQRADQWRDTAGVADDALAAIIRQDGVDILVDLTQHMAGNRLPLFAHQPAPVQVSLAGYPESTGLEAIPNRISDRNLEISGRISAAAEQVFLMDSFWCYHPCGLEVEVKGPPAHENGWVTFGSLNNFCKINALVLKTWARILSEVKNSRLLILSSTGSHRERTLNTFQHEGIEPGRVEFCPAQPRREYLELYHRLDIALDPFPCNGHTTTLDALWMGVPVVTLAGKSPVGRGGLSILSNAGLPEFVTYMEEDYVRAAVRLAADRLRLAELRGTLRARLEASVLMDAQRFTHGIETIYRALWRRWCAEHAS